MIPDRNIAIIYVLTERKQYCYDSEMTIDGIWIDE
jgi:hypothetical protein